MKPEEHLLMVALLAKQFQAMQTLIEILESRGVLQADDYQAFHAYVRSNQETNDEMRKLAQATYLAYANALGVKVEP